MKVLQFPVFSTVFKFWILFLVYAKSLISGFSQSSMHPWLLHCPHQAQEQWEPEAFTGTYSAIQDQQVYMCPLPLSVKLPEKHDKEDG